MKGVCYLCSGKNLALLRDKLRYGIKRKVLRCRNCGLVFLEPKKKRLKQFYEKEYRKLHSPVVGKAISARERFEIYRPLQQPRIEQICHFLKPTMKVLDVGSSSGHFLFSIQKYVKECIGIEPERNDAKFANEKLGIKTYNQPLAEVNLPEGYFDLISSLEVLEHIADPLSFLKILSKYLKTDGILYLELPNFNESLRTVFNVPRYEDFDYKEPHLFYYTKDTLALLLKKAGFKGLIKVAARPNIINQLNWLLRQKPQANATLAYGEINLPFHRGVSRETKARFLNFFKKFDEEYKKLLSDNFLGSTLVFIGKKIKQDASTK